MRLLWLLLIVPLSGCVSGGLPSILALGDCESEPIDEFDGEVRGTVHECTNVVGAGRFSMALTCDQGIAAVESEQGVGNITMTLTRANGTSESLVVVAGEEGFFDIGPGRDRTTLRSSPDFNVTRVSFGMVCIPEDWA